MREAQYAKTLDVPQGVAPAPIMFTSLRVRLPMGSEIGVLRNECNFFYHKAGKQVLGQMIHQGEIDDVFVQTMESAGYDTVGQLSADFEEEYEVDILRSEYKISGKIIEADIDACSEQDNLLFMRGSAGYRGKLYVKIEWAVYDNLNRSVAYRTVTQGYADRRKANIDGLTLIMNEAFAMAAHNLGADKNFHDLVFFGKKPQVSLSPQASQPERARLFDPREEVVIDNPPLHTISITQTIEHGRHVGVLVQAGVSHGSGFFITQQGHILTNAHVVGNAQRVRIDTADKGEHFTAEVLRIDRARDVALLKAESLPKGFTPVTLPLRTQWPRISEDIYALGAPSNRRMQDTLSKGIVSAHRKNFKVFGAKMDFIQGDVQTIGGNSGGPLLDAHGNIVGLCVAGMYQLSGESDSGLNLFIPIGDALEHLDINLTNKTQLQ